LLDRVASEDPRGAVGQAAGEGEVVQESACLAGDPQSVGQGHVALDGSRSAAGEDPHARQFQGSGAMGDAEVDDAVTAGTAVGDGAVGDDGAGDLVGQDLPQVAADRPGRVGHLVGVDAGGQTDKLAPRGVAGQGSAAGRVGVGGEQHC
jgi:hypothetical protein